MELLIQKMHRVGEAIYTYWPGFSGRGTRREFLSVIGFTIVALVIIDGFLFVDPPMKSGWASVVGLGRIALYPLLIWAVLSATVRRLHDTGKNGLFLFVVVAPYLGPFFLTWSLLAGPDGGDNDYGPDPRQY